jgi:endonuclease YncB( thermonuclease family)
MLRKIQVLVVALAMLFVAAVAANTLTVVRVHAGDIIEFEGGWKTRLTGITVPSPRDPMGYQAFDFTKRHLEGNVVAVFTWTTDNTAAGIVYGEDGLPFAKVMYGKDLSIDIAALLLEKGYAQVNDDRLPEGYEHYREIERKARGKGLGVWAR